MFYHLIKRIHGRFHAIPPNVQSRDIYWELESGTPWAASLTQQGVRRDAGQILAQEAEGLERIRILTGALGGHRTRPKGFRCK